MVRYSKDHIQQATGDVDELNSHIGVLRSASMTRTLNKSCRALCNTTIRSGGELAVPLELVTDEHLAEIETYAACQTSHYRHLRVHSPGEPYLPVTVMWRAVARRAERSAWPGATKTKVFVWPPAVFEPRQRCTVHPRSIPMPP